LLVGQSGVGKSSLVNALAPEAAAQTAELTRDAEGGTPPPRLVGISWTRPPPSSTLRESATSPRPPTWCALRNAVLFEIHERSVQCRFKDCRHMEEPVARRARP